MRNALAGSAAHPRNGILLREGVRVYGSMPQLPVEKASLPLKHDSVSFVDLLCFLPGGQSGSWSLSPLHVLL
ncbi:hypothetical protein BRADI_5g20403v3 [Brachypodium distachyon]|uniref:Uncharacterized protein n=1 Tax=Brachypodium distachyon TaxID=15368 RepID=A0A2K2CIB9_BRADI|nr:hypothetical protein BRADI_5g20403v3 [Brachypodium distachyon]